MTDEERIDAYIDWSVARKGNVALSMYQYRLKLLDMARFVAPTPLMGVEGGALDEWVQRENRRGGLNSASTQAKDITIVRSFFQFAIRKGWRRDDPTVDLIAPKIRNKNPRPIGDELWLDWYGAPHVEPDALLFTGLGYLCGLRRAEILRVTGAMVNPRSLVISGLVRKGGGDDTIIVRDLIEVVAQGLPHLLPDGGQRFLDVFGTRVRASGGLVLDWSASQRREWRRPENVLGDDEADPQWVYKRIRRWAKHAGIPTYKPHDLRHSFVTNLLRADVPLALVSRLANHSDFAVTSRYASLGGNELRQLVRSRREPSVRVSRFHSVDVENVAG